MRVRRAAGVILAIALAAGMTACRPEPVPTAAAPALDPGSTSAPTAPPASATPTPMPTFTVVAPAPAPTLTRTPTPTPTPTPTRPASPPQTHARHVDCTKKKCVALTFDDGPDPVTTPRLLRILERERVPATFFVLGSRAKTYPSLLRRMVRDGHEIGNHTWSHPDLTDLKPKQVRSQIARTSRAIEAATGSAPAYLRPPYGARDKKVDRAARDAGLAEVLWSVDTRDWAPGATKKKIVKAAARARRGAVVLMHDIHPKTVAAVPAVIAALRKKGYTLVTVSDLFGDTKSGSRYYGRY